MGAKTGFLPTNCNIQCAFAITIDVANFREFPRLQQNLNHMNVGSFSGKMQCSDAIVSFRVHL